MHQVPHQGVYSTQSGTPNKISIATTNNVININLKKKEDRNKNKI